VTLRSRDARGASGPSTVFQSSASASACVAIGSPAIATIWHSGSNSANDFRHDQKFSFDPFRRRAAAGGTNSMLQSVHSEGHGAR
jgi:hypothetical protein